MTYITIATPNEMKLVKEYKEKNRRMEAAPVIITGVGPLNVIKALGGLDRDTDIINLGYAGSPDFQKGTTLEIGISRTYHEIEYSDQAFILPGLITCYTALDFVTETDRRNCVFDMELAFICALGFRSVHAYKTISDNCSVAEYEETIGR